MSGPRALAGHHRVVVVGGGQAGLAMSFLLGQRGIEHIVLERRRVGHEWRERRWESFCLVTPNWQCRLPGFAYQGTDPDGFMSRDQTIRFLEAYSASFKPPLAAGVTVTRVRRRRSSGYEVGTDHGDLTADQVVVATGPYHRPALPRVAERVPAGTVSLHSSAYRRPDQLPPGAVLVVGTGQSGCQIAEDLHLAGRRVHLAAGSAPRTARRYRGRDVTAWLEQMGYYDRGVNEFADADQVRLRANHYVTGRDGGRDIDLRAFARDGMGLHGRLAGIDPAGIASFAADLRQRLDHADAVAEGIKDTIDAYLIGHGIEAPAEPRYSPVWAPPADLPSTLDLSGIAAVVWATGFHTDYRWLEAPVFDGRGRPVHTRGVTACPGLYFLGLPWLHTWGSGRFLGVGRDAAYLLERITAAGRRPAGDEVSWITGPPLARAGVRHA